MDKINFEDFSNLDTITEMLNEIQIQFNSNKDNKFGNVVILAGGAASGKGFILSNLIGIEGKVFDVDALKTLAMKSEKINQIVQKEFGVSLKDMDLKNPDDVFKMHTIIGTEMRLPNKQQQAFYTSVLQADPSRKPNIIFDVTLKDVQKLDNITRMLDGLGYDKKKINIVWVVNDIEVAKAQNLSRERSVPEYVLVGTHKGVSSTMQDLVEMGAKLRQVIDGDIFFAFNKVKVDSEYVKSANGGGYIKKANYVQIKKSGQAPLRIEDISKDILNKLDLYTPSMKKWNQ